MRLYVFDLSTMDNQEFHEFFEECYGPCVVLFEDIDSVFEGRKNIASKEHGLTFECLINHISGVVNAEGKFIIVTSNHPETLDLALTRPGRLDNKFEIGYLSKEAKIFTANKILRDWPEEVEKVLADKRDILGAEFENTCVQIATKKFWEKAKST